MAAATAAVAHTVAPTTPLRLRLLSVGRQRLPTITLQQNDSAMIPAPWCSDEEIAMVEVDAAGTVLLTQLSPVVILSVQRPGRPPELLELGISCSCAVGARISIAPTDGGTSEAAEKACTTLMPRPGPSKWQLMVNLVRSATPSPAAAADGAVLLPEATPVALAGARLDVASTPAGAAASDLGGGSAGAKRAAEGAPTDLGGGGSPSASAKRLRPTKSARQQADVMLVEARVPMRAATPCPGRLAALAETQTLELSLSREATPVLAAAPDAAGLEVAAGQQGELAEQAAAASAARLPPTQAVLLPELDSMEEEKEAEEAPAAEGAAKPTAVPAVQPAPMPLATPPVLLSALQGGRETFSEPLAADTEEAQRRRRSAAPGPPGHTPLALLLERQQEAGQQAAMEQNQEQEQPTEPLQLAPAAAAATTDMILEEAAPALAAPAAAAPATATAAAALPAPAPAPAPTSRQPRSGRPGRSAEAEDHVGAASTACAALLTEVRRALEMGPDGATPLATPARAAAWAAELAGYERLGHLPPVVVGVVSAAAGAMKCLPVGL